MDLIPLILFICINFPPVFTGTTIRFNVRGNQLFQKKIPSSNPFYNPSSSSSSIESSLPSILLASTLASSMVTDALMIHKEMQRESNADRRDSGIMESIKSGLGSATTSIGSRLDLKSGLNNLYDKFQPLWGRQPTFGSMLSDITNTKSNEQKTFKLPASLAEKLGTSSITTSGSSSGSSVEPSTSGSSTSSKWVNPFVNYPVARTTKSPAPVQTTPAPSVASSIRHQVVMPFSSVPGQSWSSSTSSSGQPWPPYPYAGYHGYHRAGMTPGMSASHPYAVVVPPPTTTTPAPPKTPRTIVIEEDEEEEEEGENGGKGGEISIGGIQAKQVLKLLGNAAASSGVNLGNVMQTVISTAVTSVAAGLAAARNQQPVGVNPFLPMAPIVPMQGYGQQQSQYGGQQQLLTQPPVNPFQVKPIQQQFQSQQVQSQQPQQQQIQSQEQQTQYQQQQQQQIQSQQSQQEQTSGQSSEVDTLSNNPKSKDEIIDDGDEEVIVIRRPKLKLPKSSSSNQQVSTSNHQVSTSNHQVSTPYHQVSIPNHQVLTPYHQISSPNHQVLIPVTSIQSTGQSIPQSVELQSSQPSLSSQMIAESLASQFQSFLSSAASSSQLSSSSSQSSSPGSNHHTNEDTKLSDPSKSSAPYIKIGINFKLQNPNFESVKGTTTSSSSSSD